MGADETWTEYAVLYEDGSVDTPKRHREEAEERLDAMQRWGYSGVIVGSSVTRTPWLPVEGQS